MNNKAQPSLHRSVTSLAPSLHRSVTSLSQRPRKDTFFPNQNVLIFFLLLLIVLVFNETSSLVGHFVSSPREREKEEIVEEIKVRDREERVTGIKGKKQKK